MSSFLDPVTIIPPASPKGGAGAGPIPSAPGSATLSRYVRQQQAEDHWCWAAVASSVAVHYAPSSPWSQCEIASHELGHACCGPLSSTVCDIEWTLDGPLTRVGNFDRFSAGPETEAFVRSEISSDRPVGCRVAWSRGKSHFLALNGWSVDPAGLFWVDIQDPFYGLTQQTISRLSTAYLSAGDSWTHTYTTSPHNVFRSAATGGGTSPTSA